MQILGLLGMYFDAVVVFVKKISLLFRLALAIQCIGNVHLGISSKLNLHIFKPENILGFLKRKNIIIVHPTYA